MNVERGETVPHRIVQLTRDAQPFPHSRQIGQQELSRHQFRVGAGKLQAPCLCTNYKVTDAESKGDPRTHIKIVMGTTSPYGVWVSPSAGEKCPVDAANIANTARRYIDRQAKSGPLYPAAQKALRPPRCTANLPKSGAPTTPAILATTVSQLGYSPTPCAQLSRCPECPCKAKKADGRKCGHNNQSHLLSPAEGGRRVLRQF